MRILLGLLRPLQIFNDFAGWLGRSVSVAALALMVIVILLQVFCRYILNDALQWPDEAARFLMLWLTGLMAPVAFRQGSFVAIDTLSASLPRRGVSVLALALFVVSLLVLIVALQLGLRHVNSGWLFASASLRLPLDLIGLKAVKIKLAWMYLSLFSGVLLMIAVNLEMIVRQLLILGNHDGHLRPVPGFGGRGAE